MLEGGETGLALGADGHDATGYRDSGALCIEYFGGIVFLVPFPTQSWDGGRRFILGGGEAVGVDLVAQAGDLFELALAELKEILFEV